jgi:predicted DNA-binding transcriptional regulator AlpA
VVHGGRFAGALEISITPPFYGAPPATRFAIATDVVETTLPTYAIQPADERADAPAGRVIPLDADALLYEIEVAYLTGQSQRTLQAQRQKGGGPEFVKIGKAGVRYQRCRVLEWIDARRRRSTSDPGPEDHGGPPGN